jgi:hypothetical protein
MLFLRASWLLGSRFAFLGMGRMFPGTPASFLGTFWLLGKTPSFLGTLKWFLGIDHRIVSSSAAGPTYPLKICSRSFRRKQLEKESG